MVETWSLGLLQGLKLSESGLACCRSERRVQTLLPVRPASSATRCEISGPRYLYTFNSDLHGLVRLAPEPNRTLRNAAFTLLWV